MRDLHCHILPGVDDGARDLGESLSMIEAAKRAGVTRITCTPHCREPYFDFDKMWAAYRLLSSNVEGQGVQLQMGFEVAHTKLMELGIDAAHRLHFEDSNEFLLEFDFGATEMDFREYARTIYELQGMGYEVIIAHPERYRAIHKKPELADDLLRMGCKLQASADFIAGGRGGWGCKRCAKRLFERRAYSYIASDAHRPGDYELLAKACAAYEVRGTHAAVGWDGGLGE